MGSGTLRRVAERVLDGRSEVTIVSAMAPQQPDRVLHALLREARARRIAVRLCRLGMYSASARIRANGPL